MKKIISAAAISALLMSGAAFAANNTNTGCGLGSVIFADGGDFADSTVGQSFIFTTNGILGNQSFGITSGTSNCDQPSKFVKNDRLHEFVVANMDTLAKDIAVGEGEALDTLAELMEITTDEKGAVFTKLQANFSTIYSSEDVTAANVVDNIITVIQS
jgi:hypothetical protein